jgi:spore maturation protein CgeB
LGAKRVIFVDKTFDIHAHRPIPVSLHDVESLGGDVGFIGTYERERAESMLYLAANGVPVRVWGNRWRRWSRHHPNLLIENRPLNGDDYVKGLSATRINLGFLRKMNRALQTDRTMEIPACGAFMLAERTAEHRRLFEEGKEAAYFGSNEELLEKVRYYLHHEEERKKIAAAGRQRCLDSGYSHHERLKYMLTVATDKE